MRPPAVVGKPLTGAIANATRRSGDMLRRSVIGVGVTFLRFEPSAFITNR
jgi:hypothetical protein